MSLIAGMSLVTPLAEQTTPRPRGCRHILNSIAISCSPSICCHQSKSKTRHLRARTKQILLDIVQLPKKIKRTRPCQIIPA